MQVFSCRRAHVIVTQVCDSTGRRPDKRVTPVKSHFFSCNLFQGPGVSCYRRLWFTGLSGRTPYRRRVSQLVQCPVTDTQDLGGRVGRFYVVLVCEALRPSFHKLRVEELAEGLKEVAVGLLQEPAEGLLKEPAVGLLKEIAEGLIEDPAERLLAHVNSSYLHPSIISHMSNSCLEHANVLSSMTSLANLFQSSTLFPQQTF